MFSLLGQAVYRWRWLVLALWVAVAVACAPLLPRVSGVLKVGGFSSEQLEAARARALLERELGYNSSALLVLFHDASRTIDDPGFNAEVVAALDQVRSMPQVERVVDHLVNPRQVSADRHTVYAVLVLRGNPQATLRALPDVRNALRPGSLRMYVTGGPAFYSDIESVSERDLRRAEIISIPLAAAALVLVFGSVVAAGVPLAVGGFSVAATLGLIYLLGQVADLSIFTLNLATMLGLGLGIDYSLFVTSRFREEAHRRDVAGATAVAVATAGRAIFFSGLTVLIGLLALTTFDFMMLRSIGLVGALVVAVSVIAALTLLPALLALIGPRIDALSVPSPFAAGAGEGFWRGLGFRVMRHPLAVFLPTMALLLLMGSPFLGVRFNAPDASILPTDVESRQGFDLLVREFGVGESAPVLLAIRTDGSPLAPANLDALYDLTTAIRADPRVSRVEGITALDPRLTREQYHLLYSAPRAIADPYARLSAEAFTRDGITLVAVYLAHPPTSPEARQFVKDIRATPLGAGMSMLVGGAAAEIYDVVSTLYREFVGAAAIVLLSTYAVLLVLFRSLLLPLKAIVMNTLSILASFGALVFVFQEGHFHQMLGFTPLGFVEASQPILLFCILFGLSMDYEIFLLTRVKEAHDGGADNATAVATGLQRSGRIITSAALIVVVVAGSFVAADIILVKALGLGVALAVLIDATVIRALLVPATMRLLGELNWWAPPAVLRWLPAPGPLGREGAR